MVPWHTGQRRLGFLAAADPAAGGQDRGLDPDDPAADMQAMMPPAPGHRETPAAPWL